MKKILLILLVFSIPAIAQIPYTFKAGGTAKAAEVNANLAYLMKRIDSLKQSIENAQLPIGTIIATMRPIDTVNEIWVLADGRTATTAYFEATGKANVPDLRGQFLRGLNEGRDDGKESPGGNNRKAGEYQADTVKSHNHNNEGFTYLLMYNNGYNAAQVQTKTDYPDVLQKGAILPYGGAETRPRNTAVYWYVKVK